MKSPQWISLIVAIVPPLIQLISAALGHPIDLGALGQIVSGVAGTSAVAHLAMSEPIQSKSSNYGD